MDCNKPYLPYWFPRWTRQVEYFIRTKIFKHNLYLIDNWTIEKIKTLDSQHAMGMEEELAAILLEEIEKEIKENGTQTWKEICEEVNIDRGDWKRTDTLKSNSSKNNKRNDSS